MSITAVVPALLLIGGVGQTGTPPPAAAPVAADPAPPVPIDPAPSATPPAARTRHSHIAHAPGDPLESFNRKSFASFQSVDRKFYRPVAMGYKHVVPRFLRSAIRHFFSNLGEPIVFVNYVLQLKPGKAAETVARFAINSTLGLAGTVDLAKSPGVRLPHRPNGFGDTLGYYGVKPGPYLFLPFVGPTTLRDLVGTSADGVVLPSAIGKPFTKLYYQIPAAILPGLDQRVEADADLRALTDSAIDPYATLRSAYLQDRASEIRALHGHRRDATGSTELSDPLADPAAGAAPKMGTSAAPELSDPMTDPAAAPPAPATTPPPARPSTAPELDDLLKDPAAKPPS